jgi:hypothetical protein
MSDKKSDGKMKPKTIAVRPSITGLLALYPACDAPDHNAPAPNELALDACQIRTVSSLKGHMFVRPA